MGCDIHAAIEYRQAESKPWQALLGKNKYFGKYGNNQEFTARIDIGRDYDLFAILGNVRNGSGFAGIKSGGGYDPMSDNRGVPGDISREAGKVLSNEHSATWVTLAEILAYDWDRSTSHRGCVTAKEFDKWERRKEWDPQPDSWSGGVSGQNIKMLTNDEMRDAIKDRPELLKEEDIFPESGLYTWIEWENTYSADGQQMWTKILPKMLNLGRVYGFDNVRLVMDFDS